jgi:hypothetical protein
VEISGWLLENGEVMLSVQDEGIGMTISRMAGLNARLTEFDPESPYDQEGEEGLGLGLYVVARLAHRHGVRVQLRDQKQGGIAAVVVLPSPLLAAAPTSAVPSATPLTGDTHSYSLPGASAESNSNVLHGRSEHKDPLVALAEQAVRETPAETSAESPAETSAGNPVEIPAESPAEMTMELLLPLAQEDRAATEAPRAADGRGADARAAAHERSAADGEFAPQGPPAPDDDGRTGGAGGSKITADGEAEAVEHERAQDEDPVTDKGLPKRTPKITQPAQAPRQRTGTVDAEALRRRLGGFRAGASAGYRDVEAEIAEKTGQNPVPAPRSATAPSEEPTGGTVEEASS